MILKRKVFKYIDRFGVIHGLRLFFSVRRSRKKGLLAFRLPGIGHQVSIRRDSSDFSVFEEIFIDGQYDILPVLPHAASLFIIDAGANIGLASLLFLKKYPKATIICIEPEPGNFALLEKNMKFHKNVICLKSALWCRPARLMIKDFQTDSWAFEVVETNEGSHSLEVVTIDSLIKQFHLPGIDILKMDIEGSEKEVFEMNTGWLDVTKYLVVEIHEDLKPGVLHQIMNLMENKGYRYHAHGATYHFFK